MALTSVRLFLVLLLVMAISLAESQRRPLVSTTRRPFGLSTTRPNVSRASTIRQSVARRAVVQRNVRNAQLPSPGSSITVKGRIGRSLVIDNNVLRLPQQPRCRVSVISEPQFQMVGELYPKTFNCDFKEGEVVYRHGGSTLLARDFVKLRVTEFINNNAVSHYVQIEVDVNRSATFDNVPDFKPLEPLLETRIRESSNAITTDVLKIRFDPLKSVCRIVYRPTRFWPARGSLTSSGTRAPQGAFESDCMQFLLGGYRYEHHGDVTLDRDFLPFEITVTSIAADYVNTRSESIFLPVLIVGGKVNEAPRLSQNRDVIELETVLSEPAILPVDNFVVYDAETESNDLVISTIEFSDRAAGGFVNLDSPHYSISSFYGKDLIEGRVGIRLTYFSPRVEFVVHFVLTDAQQNSSNTMLTRIVVSLIPREPFHFFTQPVAVHADGSVAITLFNILPKSNQTSFINALKILGLYKFEGGGQLNASIEEQKMMYKVDPLSSRYGQLLDDRNNAVTIFKLRDLFANNTSRIFYRHRQPSVTDCASCYSGDYTDKIDLIANYSDWSMRISLLVRIVLGEDQQRMLLKRNGTVQLALQRSQTFCLGLQHLLPDEVATDSGLALLERNVAPSNLVFSIRQRPGSGQVAYWPYLNLSLRNFSLAQVRTGVVCYKHTQPQRLTDSLTFITPFGDSNKLSVQVNVNRGAARPIECDGAGQAAVSVRETEVLQLKNLFRCRHTDGSTEQEIAYRIIAQPYAAQTAQTNRSVSQDCGKLVDGQERTDRTDSLTEITKQRLMSYSPLSVFAQSAVSAGRILFVPQVRDVGINERTVTFAYCAVDGLSVGPVLTASIRILPVNNQPPKVVAKRFSVRRGESVALKIPDSMTVSDEDTELTSLTFNVRSLPTVGQLKIGNANARVGQTLTYANMLNGQLSYAATSSRSGEETRFELSVSDGNNTQIFPILISVLIDELVTTRRPRNRLVILNTTLVCEENGQVILPSSLIDGIFSNADGTEDFSTIKLLILRYPTLGSLARNGGRLQGVCTYSDMQAGLIVYKHRGEVGFQPKLDSVSFFVNTTDASLIRASPWAADIAARTQFQLRISVTPADNQAPRLTIWSGVNVQEGSEAQLLPEHFIAADDDTESSKLEFIVSQRPTFGQLEVRARDAERRVISEDEPRFSWDEFESGAIYYVQSVHRNVEPVTDQFSISVSDGERSSETKTVNVVIHPLTDEELSVTLENFTVAEGGTFELDENSFSFSSADVPAVTLFFVVSSAPLHGFVRSGTRNISFFTSEDLRDRSRFRLNYKHDNTNTLNDTFSLRISNGVTAVERTCFVTVTSLNDDRPMVKLNRPIFGATGSNYVLRNTELLVIDGDTGEDDITFRLAPGNSLSGNFSIDDQELTDDGYFTQGDVNAGRVSYNFPSSIDGGKRSVLEKAIFNVSDGVQSIRMQFTINVTAATVQTALGDADFNFSAVDIENVALGGRIELSPTRLRMSLSPAARRLFQADSRLIVYRVESVINGRVIHKNSLLTPIDTVDNIESFTRQDVEQKNILYRAPEVTNAMFDECSFTIEVPRLSISKSVTLTISFNLSAYEMPVVQRNDELSVVRRSRLAIADSKLLATDVDTLPAGIIYRIVQQPKNGRLIMDNALRPAARRLRSADYVSVSSFSQLDVNRNLIYYQHDDNTSAADDHFEFVVTDGEHVFFVDNSTGTPVSLDSRRSTIAKRVVITTSEETVTERSRQSWLNAFQLRVAMPNNFDRFSETRATSFGYAITRDLFEIDFNLQESTVAKQDFIEKNLRDSIFVITRAPSFGTVRNVNKRRQRVQNFTLADLAANHIRYVATSPATSNADYLTFNLIDAQTRLTLSSNERLNFAWPIVEFAKGSLSVCYNTAGYLTLNLTQKGGSANQTALVRIILKDPQGKVILLDQQTPQGAEKLLGEVSVPISQGFGQISQVYNMRFPLYDRYQLTLEEKSNVVIGSAKTASISVVDCRNSQTEDFTDFGRMYGIGRKEKTTARPRATTAGRRRGEPRTTTDQPTASGTNSRSLISAIGNAGPMNDPPVETGNKSQSARRIPSKREKNGPCLPIEQNAQVYDSKAKVTLKCDGKRWTVVKSAEAPRAPRQTASCPAGWTLHNKFCYKPSVERVSWGEARKRCTNSGATLVTVQSRSHMEWLFGLNGRQTYWIGMYQSGFRNWQYTSKRKATFFYWADNFPTGYPQSNKNCVLVNNLQWYNRLCSVLTRFICEMPSRA